MAGDLRMVCKSFLMPFQPKAGTQESFTYLGTNSDTLGMSCTQILAIAIVKISGNQTLSERIPSQNELTDPAPVISIVNTGTPGRTTFTGANCTVTGQGDSAITAKGFCYAVAILPTTSNSILACGSGLGSFSGTLTGLTPNTGYSVRAYATNSYGTRYSGVLAFTTLP